MMKKSSTKMAQNGRMPVRRTEGSGWSDLAQGGIWRGIWLTFVAGLSSGCLKPIQLPAALRGTLMTNQIPIMASMVVNGTAPLDPLAQTNRLRRKKVQKTMPGTNIGVTAMFSFQFSPPKVLYARADTYPPMKPKRVYRSKITVARNPLFDGDKNP